MKPTPEMLASLGITREDVLVCTAQEIAKRVLGEDPTGEFDYDNIESKVVRRVQELVDAKVSEVVRQKCEDVFAPLIESRLADYTFQETNRWGEKLGRSVTLTEFMVQRIESYMLEDVDRQGRSQEQCRARSDTFYKQGPRITVAIRDYFHFTMEEAMKTILKDSANILTGGIEKAAKEALGTIHDRLVAKVEVKK